MVPAALAKATFKSFIMYILELVGTAFIFDNVDVGKQLHLNTSSFQIFPLQIGVPKLTNSRNNPHIKGISSSFNGSTGSLASSKKSFEYEAPITNNLWPVSSSNTTTVNNTRQYTTTTSNSSNHANYYGKPNTTLNSLPNQVIANASKSKVNERKQFHSESPSPPMPSIPPPSPLKEPEDFNIPYGIALYDYQGTHPSDLSFQGNDVIILLRE
ncbi:hypothetical protein NQ318_017776 [Aromia moschata]|uniref:SH3 domain-containing protein n=1 Tax=Aromia moschata TaxID=1265417 RepID=A0AAV8XUW8_9CUCU|nr:hypothetical protein NQ318_017776 [Aromia moschata]